MKNIHHALALGAAVIVGGGGALIAAHYEKALAPAATPTPTPTVIGTATPSPTTGSLSATLTSVTNDNANRTNDIAGKVTNGSQSSVNALIVVTFTKHGQAVASASTVISGIPAGATKTFSFQSSDLYTDYDATTVTATVAP